MDARPSEPQADDLVEELSSTAERTYPYQEGRAIQKVRYSHDAMIDAILADPSISQMRLAQMFGYTAGWVSLVMSSNAFRERYIARRAELVDPRITATMEERFQAITARSLEVLQEKLSAPASVVPDALALKAAELGAKALGLGGNAPPPPVIVAPDYLDRLASRLVALKRRTYNPGEVVDVQSSEVVQGPVEDGNELQP